MPGFWHIIYSTPAPLMTTNISTSIEKILVVLVFALQISRISSYNTPGTPTRHPSRRLAFRKMMTVTAPIFLAPGLANAIDPTLLKTLPVEGDTTGGSSRLANLAAIQQS